MDKKITFTLSSLFKGEGFDKAGQAVKGMSKSVKDTTQAVGQLAGEMSGMNGTVGKVADGVGKFIGALSGGGLSLAIVGITTAVSLFSKWRDSIEETRKKNRELIEEMEDGYGKKVAFALDYARRKQEEFLNLMIDKGKTAIERLERMRDLARDLASARAGTSGAEQNLGNQQILTQAERAKAGTSNQFDQRRIELDARRQLNQRNRNQLEKEKRVQDERLRVEEQLLKDKISEWESQRGNLPRNQQNRLASIQKQIDEKNREMAVQQERINYYHDQNINGEGDYDKNREAMKKAGDERVRLSQERLKLQEEMARLQRGDNKQQQEIEDKITKAKNDLAVIEEQRKTNELNYKAEQQKLEQESYRIQTDRNKLAEDRKKKEEEDAKKARELADKEAKARANTYANNIEANAQERASHYQSKEAQSIVTARGKIDALNAKKSGLRTDEERAQWSKEMTAARKQYQDAIKSAQQAVQEGNDKQNEARMQIAQERWGEMLSARDRIKNKLNDSSLTKGERESLSKQLNQVNAQANRWRNEMLNQASQRTKNAAAEDKMDAIKDELQMLRAIEDDIRNQSVAIANNTRQTAADNLTGEQRKNNRNQAREQELLNNRINRREQAQNNAADRDIANGGWFLDENGNLKSNRGEMAPNLSRFQRERMIQRLKELQLQQQQKAIAQRIQQLQQQQVNAANQVPPKLDEIRDLLKDNLKELNNAMKVN